jgi:hypothetical protein
MEELLGTVLEFVLEVFGEVLLDGLLELFGHKSQLQNSRGMFGL